MGIRFEQKLKVLSCPAMQMRRSHDLVRARFETKICSLQLMTTLILLSCVVGYPWEWQRHNLSCMGNAKFYFPCSSCGLQTRLVEFLSFCFRILDSLTQVPFHLRIYEVHTFKCTSERYKQSNFKQSFKRLLSSCQNMTSSFETRVLSRKQSLNI